MRALLIFIITITSIINIYSQNIGIGVSDPQYKLDLAGTLNLRHVPGSTSGILFDGTAAPVRSFVGLIDNDRFGMKSNVSNSWPFQMNLVTGNIGIGNIVPAYKLDVKGRPRIRHNGASSAAIWFDGAATAQTSLIGTINNDHVGFWGNTGAGWNISMNVVNGNTGIGTAAPTSTLDVNGSLRMRSSFPKTGSVMTSSDANGNAEWEDPIAFKATGGYNDEPNIIVDTIGSVWFKIYFHQIAAYNIGVSYQAIQSQFVAPVEGVYHFETVLEWGNLTDRNNVRLMLNRNGDIYTIAESYKVNMGQGSNYYMAVKQPSRLAVDTKLLPGDIVWVEAKAFNINAAGYPNTSTVTPSNIKTWFTGNLVTRL
jgi:hypothetical protein